MKALVPILAAVLVAAAFTIHGHWPGELTIPHVFVGALVGQLAQPSSVSPMLAMLAGTAAFDSVVTRTPLSSAPPYWMTVVSEVSVASRGRRRQSAAEF